MPVANESRKRRPQSTLRALALALGGAVFASGVASADGNQLPVGYHDDYGNAVPGSNCFASGWAVDPDTPTARLAVRVSLNGVVVGTVTADLYRPDLIEAGVSPDGYAGFGLDLRGLVSLGEQYVVLVEAQDAQTGEWRALEWSPRTRTCWGSVPEGTHDEVAGRAHYGDCRAAGWAVDPDDRTVRLSVRVLVDETVAATAIADLFRQDLLDAGVSPDGYAGFDVDLTTLVTPGKPHTVRAQARDLTTGDWSDLNLTPKTLQCLPAPPLAR